MHSFEQLSRQLAGTSAVLVLIGGTLVCAAWLFSVPELTRVVDASSTVRFNAGMQFAVGAIGLLAALRQRRVVAMVTALAIGALSTLTVLEYLAQVEFGIDELFVVDTNTRPEFPAGRMAPNTAVAFLFVALALGVQVLAHRKAWASGIVLLSSALVMAMGAIAAFGYAVDLPTAFQWGGLTRMALLTAGGLMLLGLATGLAAFSQTGARSWDELPWLAASSGAGMMALAALGSQALSAAPEGLVRGPDLVLGFGIVAAVLLSGTIAQARHMRRQAADLARANRSLQEAHEMLHDSERRLQGLLDSLRTAVVVHGPDTSIQFANPAAAAMLGLTRDQLMGRTTIDPYWHFIREDGSVMPVTEYPVSLVFASRKPLQDYVVGVRVREGEPTRWVLVNAIPDIDAGDTVRQIIVSFMDISDRKRQAEEMAALALTDVLTGLSTRRNFTTLAEQAIRRARREREAPALLVLDVDHFKSINDNYGHAGGDAVLQHLASVMQHALRESDIAGRLGGEEFAVLLPCTDSATATEIGQRLRELIAASPASVAGAGDGLCYTVSIGIATLSAEDDLARLLDRADQAMYQAKRSGRNRVCIADDAPATTAV